ncbi:hypothetical protein BFL38_13415 [Brachyspira hampsonii]|uniref:Uncharacterized protein n=1 Tax=Brachyspira hampsonii TaxID=1287055 RepID=A0A1E5NGP4_9SPIR|nr:hypothetical protein [Brachyspira hampsonii]OEJ15296.1 hypothetical protein BFL38_13415 [Brachyspira hampsonii]
MNNTLEIVLNNQAQVTSIKCNGSESLSLDQPITIKEGADYTGTTIATFVCYESIMRPDGIIMIFPVIYKIYFKSATDASQGAILKSQLGRIYP